MTRQDGRSRGLWASFLLLGVLATLGADDPTKSRAVGPITPDLPGPVVASMQEGNYPEAAMALDRLIAAAKSPSDRSYYRFLRGIAERLGGKADEARVTLGEALKLEPAGPWAGKIRFELAAVELAAGRTAEAETLARVEAETLLAPDRKDRLAGVYHAFARRLLTPGDPVSKPDPAGAYALLAKARELAKGATLRASLLFEMARAGQSTGSMPRNSPQGKSSALAIDPIRDFRAYLNEYPNGADRLAARFHLGEAQLAAGQDVAARMTWTDLAREIGSIPGPSKEQTDLVARSLYQVARTYGIPNPPDDTQLNLGVAALRRFVTAFPAHPEAVHAAFEIGQAYLNRNQGEAAIEAFRLFPQGYGVRAETDEARRELAERSRTVAFLVARTLQGQGKFAEAIAAYQAYLTQSPNGPESAESQRSILDAELQAAADALTRQKPAEARALWQTFVTQNPLDARVPQILFELGESFVSEHRFDEAIAAWEPLIGKFAGSEPAAHAQFEVASILELEKGDPAGAIERFRKVAAPWKPQADQRVAVMEAKALKVVTPRAFRSGEPAQLRISSRNLETLTFSAYKLDAEAYFRKKHELGDVQSLDVGLVAPDAEWTVPVPGSAKFKPVESTYDLKVAVPGVWVVKVSDEKTLQATALVVGGDLDAIVKVSREQVLVFAQDMKTGKGRKGARVLIADESGLILEKATGDDGVLLASWDKPRQGQLHYLVLDAADAAGSNLGVPDKVAQGLNPRAYIYTDRPAYRPGQEVALRGVVREAKDGQYANPAVASYKLEVYDARGRLLIAREARLSEFGTFHEAVRLDSNAPVGSYRVRLFKPGQGDFAGSFEVQSYKLEKIDLEFDLPRTVYYRGETIKAGVVAKYQYGSPVASRPIEVVLPDGRLLRGMTDASGKFAFEVTTDGFAEEQALRLVARLPGDNVAAAAGVMLAIKGFQIDLATSRTVYLDGETFALAASTVDAQGKPIGQELRISVLKQVNQGGRITEREVAKHVLTTDPATGKGTLSLRVEDDQGGSFVLRAAGTDQFKNPIVADRDLEISGKADANRLRLLTDRQSFKVGESASVNLHSRSRPGTALLTWEADRILQYKLMPIQEGDNPLTWPVDGPQFPNFTLTAATMAADRFESASLDIRVERDLKVVIKPTKPSVGPGEEVEVEVTTVDQLDRPVAAEVGLALIDRSLLSRFADTLPPIGSYFYDQTRTGAFATEATNTFHDEPDTLPVAEAVVEEAERLAAQARNEASREQWLKDAKMHGFVNMAQPGQQAQPGRAMFANPSRSIAPFNAVPQAPAGLERKSRQEIAGEGSITTFNGQAANVRDAGEGSQFQLGLTFSVPTAMAIGGGPIGLDNRQPRKVFTETAYWNPSIVTGPDGKATVKFKAPMALSEYRFSARGVTGADTLVGQATATLAVKQDFFVDLKVPATLTQGDKPRFSAEVHHVGVKGPAEVRLAIYAGDREQVDPKTLDLKGDGVDAVRFDPFEVPDGESVRLTLTAKCGDKSDELVVEIPIRPWGVQAFASASGTSTDDVTTFVALPPGRTYDDPEMRIDLAPTLRRLLIDLALGHSSGPITRNEWLRMPVVPDTIADRASDLIAATAALAYLREARTPEAPEAARLTSRIQGVVAELISAQNDDGSWPWVTPRADLGRRLIGDRLASAHASVALASARSVGLLADPSGLEKATTYLAGEFARAGTDSEARAAILHALAASGKASFEQANALARSKQSLPDDALAYLALTLHHLDRASLAGEVLDVLATRAKSQPVGIGKKPLKYWDGADQGPFHRGAVETTALAALAFARVRPQATEFEAASEWLLAHRLGDGWTPRKAKGAAVAALAAYYGKAGSAEGRYRLVITVNDVEVHRSEVAGPAEAIAVAVPRKAIKLGAPNRVRFEIEGRGTFGYAVALTGFARDFRPEQRPDGKRFRIKERLYQPADPELDGRSLPTGFSVAINPTRFVNKVTQVAEGGRAKVQIVPESNLMVVGARDREFLVIEETLPAGATLIEGSVLTYASSYTLADGVLTFYFPPDSGPSAISYEIAGYLPGHYRVPPTKIRSAYDPGLVHLGEAGELTILSPGEKSTDPYKATPDELYARGKALFGAGKLAEAAVPLEELAGAYTLNDATARDAARMLLAIHIKDYQPRKIVQDFEILREKGPDLIIPFDEVAVVGRAYRDIGEAERAYLVFRAIVEASYLEDAEVGEALRQRGRTLDATAYLLDLWRESPDTASIEADFFGLSQVVAAAATRSITDPTLRQELAEAGVTRSQLILQAIRMVQVVLAESPRSPLADEASLALLNAYLELEDFESVVKLAPRFAKLYPKSTFLDSFQYAEALGRFALGEYDRAVGIAEAIARASYKDANGLDQPSPNKWQALYILGQIHDARRDPAKAVEYYRQVADRFADAAGAVAALTRKGLTLPEVTIVRPGGVAPASIALGYRNVAEVDLRAYPVDLMRLYLTRRNLDDVAKIDLAGISPTFEADLKLGDGLDFADKTRAADIPLNNKEGAYLVMARGGDLDASGILLVTPLELEVLEEADSGRVRVVVRDAVSKAFVPKVQVKVIGTANPTFVAGQTDLRGVFVAEGIQGQVTAVARKGTGQYAFYRGKAVVVAGRIRQATAPGQKADDAKKAESLDNNLKIQNSTNQDRQLDRLQNRFKSQQRGVNPF